MEPITTYIPKPSTQDREAFNELESEIISALKADLIDQRNKRGLLISDDHIDAETTLQFMEQVVNDNPNVVIKIDKTTEEVLASYEGLSREFIIFMLERERLKPKTPTYAEMARHNEFF